MASTEASGITKRKDVYFFIVPELQPHVFLAYQHYGSFSINYFDKCNELRVMNGLCLRGFKRIKVEAPEYPAKFK